MGSLTRPGLQEPPKGGNSSPQVQLLQTRVLCFLFLNVFAYLFLVPSDRGYKVPPGPEVLTYEVPLPFTISPGQVDRTFPLDEANHLRHRIFRRNRNQHVHVIREKMTLFDPALFLLRQPAKYLS